MKYKIESMNTDELESFAQKIYMSTATKSQKEPLLQRIDDRFKQLESSKMRLIEHSYVSLDDLDKSLDD